MGSMNKRRFSISVEDELQMKLESTKEEYYKNANHSNMIRDLIIRGLQSLKNEPELNLAHKDQH
jgi:hypothetical protein